VKTLEVVDLGCCSYGEAHTWMEDRLAARARGECPDTLILCEHPPVFTVGRGRDAEESILAPGDIPVVKVSRGGNVTYHAPGQLVGYPILKLEGRDRDLHAYLRWLEDFWISFLQKRGLPAGRDTRNTGVWVSGAKMVAIGISCRRWVTWHGFAWNNSIGLEPYRRINPCGMPPDLVTRFSDHHPAPPSMEQAREQVALEFRQWMESESIQARSRPRVRQS
jgi:lipoyl(octanoyl) transferase